MINEFMAFNQDFLEDEDGNHPDWIELYNSDSAAYDLDGHFLTDDPDNLDKWMFPAVSIPSGGHLLVFASEKDRRDARGELHTNFRLDGDGDQLLLITPDGSTILSGFFPSFPPQVEDTSYGVSTNSTFIELVGSDASNRVLVPTDSSLESTWMNRTFNDNSWRGGRGGVGFERGTGYDEFISTDVEADMYQQNGGVYIRIPFEVEDRDTVDQLRLQMRYDDGFTAYLNGSPILSVNSPSAENLAWNSNASLSHTDTRAREYENFDLGEDGLLSLRVRGPRRLQVVRPRGGDNGRGLAAGGRRTTVGTPSSPSNAPSNQCPVASGTMAGAGPGAAASTTVEGDAVARNPDTGPTHRRAAQRARSIRAAEGPIPLSRDRGRSSTPAGGTTWSSTTQPPTRRPPRTTRTRLPTPRLSARPSSPQAGGTR